MTLQNLLVIRQLQEHLADPDAIARLLASARRNLTDAKIADVSADGRFDAAYRCLMQCAMLGLWANGCRTSTSRPGHQQTAIQCLTLTMGVSREDVIVIDGLRRQRNITDYEGDPVSEAVLASCLEQAGKLLEHATRWLHGAHPELVNEMNGTPAMPDPGPAG